MERCSTTYLIFGPAQKNPHVSVSYLYVLPPAGAIHELRSRVLGSFDSFFGYGKDVGS